jgi:hypothetical protein
VKIPKTHEKSVTTTEFRTNHKETTYVKRNLHRHPYRYLNIFGVLNPDEKPVLNPPKPKPRISLTYLAISEFLKTFSSLVKTIPFILLKNPSLERIIEDMNYAAHIFCRNLDSTLDYRHRRSAAEWVLIAKHFREYSSKAASRKYPGITPDGKLEYLSPKYIKQKALKAEAYWIIFQCQLPIFLICGRIIANKVGRDPELSTIYRMYEINYESKNREVEQNWQKQLEEQQQDFYKYNREAFIIRHYDPELRKRQKLDNKKPDGKIEHRVKETEFPSKIVEELRRNRAQHMAIN